MATLRRITPLGGKTQGADEGKRGLLVHGLDLSVVGNLNRAGKAGVEDLELGGDVGDDALAISAAASAAAWSA